MDIFDDDIFDQMRKIMQNPFSGFFNDSFFEEQTNIQEELEKAIKTEPGKDKKSKSYSISYKFGTGMKEPEIHVQGDIDQDTVNQFLKGLPKSSKEFGLDFGNAPQLTTAKINPDATEPYTEIQETPEGLSIYMEMPGIGQKDIKTKWEKDTLIITGDREHTIYEKVIPVAFKAKKDVKIHANNGIITIEVQKK
jgi:HSP20 family molecular chaperone IbpA